MTESQYSQIPLYGSWCSKIETIPVPLKCVLVEFCRLVGRKSRRTCSQYTSFCVSAHRPRLREMSHLRPAKVADNLTPASLVGVIVIRHPVRRIQFDDTGLTGLQAIHEAGAVMGLRAKVQLPPSPSRMLASARSRVCQSYELTSCRSGVRGEMRMDYRQNGVS